jgi:hypothetical protein
MSRKKLWWLALPIGLVKLFYHHDRLGASGCLTDNVSSKGASLVSYDDNR